MDLSPGAVEIMTHNLNDLESATDPDGQRRAELVGQVERLRARLAQLRSLSELDTLTCLLINLGAVRFEQERYGEAIALLDEAQDLAREGWEAPEQYGDGDAALRPDRFRTLHAVAQYNRSMIFFEKGRPDAGAEALGSANDRLSYATPNPLCEGLHVALTARIDRAMSWGRS